MVIIIAMVTAVAVAQKVCPVDTTPSFVVANNRMNTPTRTNALAWFLVIRFWKWWIYKSPAREIKTTITAIGITSRTPACGIDKISVQRNTKSSHIRIEIKESVLANRLIREKRSEDMFLRTWLRLGLIFFQNPIYLS